MPPESSSGKRSGPGCRLALMKERHFGGGLSVPKGAWQNHAPFFAYRDVGTAVPAHPCAPRHSDLLSIVAGGGEKVRPRSGREAGLGHAGSDAPAGMATRGILSSCGTHTSLYIVGISRRRDSRKHAWGREGGANSVSGIKSAAVISRHGPVTGETRHTYSF
jgi:hypothetical protein